MRRYYCSLRSLWHEQPLIVNIQLLFWFARIPDSTLAMDPMTIAIKFIDWVGSLGCEIKRRLAQRQ